MQTFGCGSYWYGSQISHFSFRGRTVDLCIKSYLGLGVVAITMTYYVHQRFTADLFEKHEVTVAKFYSNAISIWYRIESYASIAKRKV